MNKPTNIIKKALSFIAIAFLTTAANNAQAVVFLWNNTGTNWTSPASWTNGVQPASTSSSATTDEIQFGNFGASNNTVVLTSTRAARNITFVTNANAYAINSFNGAQILSSSGGITNNSTATQTFNINLENANGSNTWFQTAGGAMVFNNLVSLTTASSGTSRTLTLAGGGTFTFNNSLNQGGTSTAGKVVVNAAGGTVNLNAANTLGGGIAITAGTVNFSNAGSLGTGVLELGSTTGSSYGNSVLNNASGAAINLTGVTGILWTGTSPAGIQIGTAASTAANNIDFGTGLVTAASDRSMNIAGTGVTISMGTLTASGTAASYTYKIDGAGNTLDLDGWRVSGAATPTQAVQHKISGTANVNIGTIENGTGAFANGVGFNSDGTTRLTGNNTYTGATEFTGSGTNIISGNNSAAVGNVTIAGTSGSGKTPFVRLNNTNAISSSSSLQGASSSAQMGTIDFNAGTSYVLNAYNGNNMTFTNSFGQAATVTFTNVASVISSSAGNSGGRSLINTASDLTVVFDGSVDIGSTTTGVNNTIGGAGNWLIKGNVFSTTVGSVRGLNKTGTGTLELRGANSYNGDTVISGGTLLIASGGSITGSAAQLTGGTLDVRGAMGTITQSGGTLLVTGTAGTTIINSGTSTVNAGGTIGSTTINGSLLSVNGSAGDVLVNTGGTLGGSGSVQGLTLNGGTVAPGNSPGLLTAYELNGSNGTFQFQLGAPTTRGVTYDAIDVTSMLTLGASTAFTFETLDSYTYGMGDTYDLFNFDSINADAFDSAVLLAALPDLDTSNSNLQWNVTNFTTDGIVNVIPEPSTYASLLIGLILLVLMKTKTKTKASLLAALLAVFSLNTTHAAVLGIESASNYTSATWTEGAGSNVGTWYFQNDTAAVTQIADSSQGGRTSIGTDAFNFVPGNTAFNQFANGWFVLNGGGLIAGQTLSVDANYLWNGGNRGVEFMSGNAAVFRLQHVWSDPITFAGTGLTDTQVLANGYQQALTYSVDQLDQLSVQVSAYLYGSSSALFTQTVAVPDYITGIHFYAGDVTTTTADQPNYGLFVNNIEVSGIPEPSAGSLMLLGGVALLALKKLKRKEVRI